MRLIQFVQFVIPELDTVIGSACSKQGRHLSSKGGMFRLENGVVSDNDSAEPPPGEATTAPPAMSAGGDL